MNTEDNKNFHAEFGKLLAQKYSRLVPDQASPHDVGYERAQGLGRYLRAARLNSGMSIHEVASKARMSSVEVAALEHGLLHPDEVDRTWLSSLAKVFGDDIEDYQLLLGLRSISKPPLSSSKRESVMSKLNSSLQAFSELFKIKKPLVVSFTTVALLTFLIAMGVGVLLMAPKLLGMPRPEHEMLVQASTNTPVPPNTPEIARVVINNPTVNVRSGPGTSYANIGQARNGERYDITGKNAGGNWYKINFNGQSGWVTSQYVVLEGDPVAVQVAANIPFAPVPPDTPSPPKAVIGGDGQVNVRSGPGTAYPEIGGIATGTELELVTKNAAGDWYEICCVNGEPAWIVARLVEVTGDPNLIQVAASIPAAPVQPTRSPATATLVSESLVVAKLQASLRQGPGTQYPVVGSIAGGEQAEVLGRNAESTWWQVALADGTEGWISATLVTTNGVIEGVAIAQNIPPPAQYPWTYAGTAVGAPQCGTVYFSGQVRYANGSPQNGVCVLVDYYGPRMIKFSGSGGAGNGNWSFTPCGNGACQGPIKIYIVECPADGVPDGGLTLEGSGDFPAKSDLFTANITDKCTQGQWTNITFKSSQ